MADEEQRTAELEALSKKRAAAPSTADAAAIKERNMKALAARKAKIAAEKASEASRPLPDGWRRVESRSRPGEFVYENIHTEERQAWFPEAVAKEEVSAALVAQSEADAAKAARIAKNKAALAARKASLQSQKEAEKSLPLPDGWKRVESRSRPGETVYENTVTGERQAWFPDAPASGAVDDAKAALIAKNKAALAARKAKKAAEEMDNASKPLPAGWRRVESRSRPGEFVYENELTEERQAWFPEAPAEKPLPEGWRKVESRTYPGEYVYENAFTLERQAWRPDEPAPMEEAAKPAAERTAEQLAHLAAAKAPPARAILCKAKVLYTYTAENRDEEIDLMEGDVIAVEYKADNGWWVGINTRTQRNGIFPGTYVEEM